MRTKVKYTRSFVYARYGNANPWQCKAIFFPVGTTGGAHARVAYLPNRDAKRHIVVMYINTQ